MPLRYVKRAADGELEARSAGSSVPKRNGQRLSLSCGAFAVLCFLNRDAGGLDMRGIPADLDLGVKGAGSDGLINGLLHGCGESPENAGFEAELLRGCGKAKQVGRGRGERMIVIEQVDCERFWFAARAGDVVEAELEFGVPGIERL